MRWAHPRVCGENNTILCEARHTVGSSPRVRGKLRLGLPVVAMNGLIPACAGKTTSILGFAQGAWAHPRVCGENISHNAPPFSEAGSSPRVRGKLSLEGEKVSQARLIPACAGKTAGAQGSRKIVWAHPRVCGENTFPSARDAALKGSSPRVRGKPVFASEVPDGAGLIPACAGKTTQSKKQQSGQEAHPRVCGENHRFTPFSRMYSGSSPRVRGKLFDIVQPFITEGLIPACAGKTICSRGRSHAIWAHPRVCGENIRQALMTCWRIGSSPRVRGKPTYKRRDLSRKRLIPACAGKTCWRHE